MYNKPLLSRFSALKERLYKKYSRYHHVEQLEGPRVLVLSPHPDDDVLGCGGALARHNQLGHTVQIVYLCSGNKGGKAAGLADIRKNEAIRAAAVLGIYAEALTFLGCPDERLKPAPRWTEPLRNQIDTFKPNVLYLPSFLDNHPDHQNTNRILKAINPKGITVCAYEVWTPLIPNRLIDISAVVDLKTRAIQMHASQLAQLDYLGAILGLNQYRARLYPKKEMTYAEAFLAMPAEAYLSLFKG